MLTYTPNGTEMLLNTQTRSAFTKLWTLDFLEAWLPTLTSKSDSKSKRSSVNRKSLRAPPIPGLVPTNHSWRSIKKCPIFFRILESDNVPKLLRCAEAFWEFPQCPHRFQNFNPHPPLPHHPNFRSFCLSHTLEKRSRSFQSFPRFSHQVSKAAETKSLRRFHHRPLCTLQVCFSSAMYAFMYHTQKFYHTKSFWKYTLVRYQILI